MAELGPHCQGASDAALRFARQANIVKACDNTGPLAAAPDHALRIFRVVLDAVRQDALLADPSGPQKLADLYAERLGGYRHARLLCEGLNEITRHKTAELITFTQAYTDAMASHGLRVGGPCYGTGDYDEEHIEAWRAAGWAGLAAWFTHNYWSRRFGPTEWNFYRHRTYWRPGDPDVIITEAGWDRVNDVPGGGAEPPDNPDDAYGWERQNVTPADVVPTLQQLAASLDRAYEKGITPFGFAPSDEWRRKGFDLDAFADALAAAYAPRPIELRSLSESTDIPPHPVEEGPVTTTNPAELLGDANPWRGKLLTVQECPADPAALIRIGDALKLRGFELKIADGNSSWVDSPKRHVSRAYCDVLRAHGFAVLTWSYNYCDGRRDAGDRGDGIPLEEVREAVAGVRAVGSEGHTFDLEAECEGHNAAVAQLLDVARRGSTSGVIVEPIGVPIAAHVWGALEGHETYPYGEICARTDILRPMIYRDVWNATNFWASWAKFVPDFAATWDRFVCPVWGLTDKGATADAIAEDLAVAEAHRCPGESYWEEDAALVIATSARAECLAVRNLLLPRFGAAPTSNRAALLEQHVLGPLFHAQEWLGQNATCDRDRRWQQVLDFAFRDLKGEVT
jgi:hypothetical protein